MAEQHPCRSCFLTLSENQRVCPNCGTANPYYNPAAKRVAAANQSKVRSAAGSHHREATPGKCEYCDSVIYSDDKVCPYCGAPNPNFVVHADEKDTVTRSNAEREHGTENASTGKCPYCGATVRSNERYCRSCGSENPHFIEDTARVIIHPRTIEELKEYCAERNMPLLRMRFFIGEDYRGPKAFGIFKDAAGRVTVYKNKDNGSRAIRYQGIDEKYAVNEIFQKLLEECRSRGINPDQSLNAAYANNGYRPQQTGNNYSRTGQSGGKNSKRASAGSIVKLIVLIIVMMVLSRIFFSACGYCLSTGCSDFGSGSSGGYDSGYSWDSGGSDWSSDYSWDSGSSSWDSWDSGSDSWDSWDSGGSDWGSDW